ncbi:unknown [Prevotella sp. CAG:5226]|nr:unknown [Prevotella sp. CAG:5226]
MKKISTLALALIAMGSLSMPASAQVNFEPVSTPTLESGWYQMRQVVGVTRTDISATAPRYVYSAETAKDGKYYFASDAAQKSDATAFVYVDNTDGKYAIKSINGKWGDFVSNFFEY